MAIHCEDVGIAFQDDAEGVSFVAGLLNISEFKLFEIAYANWFGGEVTEKAIDCFFGSYLHSGFVPFWLRDMVRNILCKYRKGNLNPSELGINHPGGNRLERRLGWILVVFFNILVFAIVWGSATYKSAW